MSGMYMMDGMYRMNRTGKTYIADRKDRLYEIGETDRVDGTDKEDRTDRAKIHPL
jgi:hypothetical protein